MNLDIANKALKKFFGYDSFRPMQAEIIQANYDGQDSLVLMPTGGGKSICFQIPAITKPGVCIVVSPLISLMKDQVESLTGNGVPAAFLNSSVGGAQQMEIERQALAGELKLLYVSPEKLVSSGFFGFLSRLSVNMFAIDEAHCISQWGHDFRPEYTKLKLIKQNFPDIPITALTATADKTTRSDIISQLNLGDPKVFIASFDRPNLSLTVLPGRDRYNIIKKFIKDRPDQSGIIYCLSRKSTEQVAAKLIKEGVNAAAYHAGLPSQARNKVQEGFINDTTPIICATIAFGMGIDKSNVRWVIHYNLPKNMEGYYQQIGRAGRDGLPSDTLLFYSYGDIILLKRFLEDSSQRELLEAKLDRMQQYAEAFICRRKILLNYFNEHLDKDCGNCDVCKNPPSHFDGTVVAQKALSAISRLKGKVGMNMLIDVLRGSRRAELVRAGHHKIKTYGVGANMSFPEWQQFLLQFVNLGLIDIAYEDHHNLKLTDASKRILFEGKKVKLVRLSTMKERQAEQKKKTKTKTKTELQNEELFAILRELRRNIAKAKGIPPYIVFNDATLIQMANNKPTSPAAMREISGVGDAKLRQYADEFINKILEYLTKKDQQGSKVKGSTHKVTLNYFKEGKTPEQIAKLRNLSPTTIYSHLAANYEFGEDFDLMGMIGEMDYKKVAHAAKVTGNTTVLKEIYENLNEEVPYYKIRLSLAYFKRHELVK